jgi:hypothetical protein
MTNTYTYTEIAQERADGITVRCIKREDELGNVALIPYDPANSDYQRYLNPVAEQSTPIDAGDE